MGLWQAILPTPPPLGCGFPPGGGGAESSSSVWKLPCPVESPISSPSPLIVLLSGGVS